MILSPFFTRILSVISVGMVFTYIRMLITWLDRHTGDPIMRQRINAGSEKFFAEEPKYEGRTEIESLVNGQFGDI
jgi:hypothetical protein